MSISAALDAVEAVGIVLRLDGEKVRISYPDEERRKELAERIDFLRDHKDEVLSLLRRRGEIPAMPPGVQLVHWEPKSAPVILTHYAVITDVPRFVSMTLLELKAALAGKRWRAGHWSVRELVDRLEQCGIVVQVSRGEASRLPANSERMQQSPKAKGSLQ